MKHYCLGFIFNPDQSEVALLKKRSSDAYNPDCWNGVGGRVEQGETAVEAMSRETLEETAVHIDPAQWHTVGCLSDGSNYRVDVFVAATQVESLTTTTDETVKMFNRQAARAQSLAHGVEDVLAKWLNGGMYEL